MGHSHRGAWAATAAALGVLFLGVAGLAYAGAVSLSTSTYAIPCPSAVTGTTLSGQPFSLPLASEYTAQSLYGSNPPAVWGPYGGNIADLANAQTSIPVGFISSDPAGDPPVYADGIGSFYWQPNGNCYEIGHTASPLTSPITSPTTTTTTTAQAVTTQGSHLVVPPPPTPPSNPRGVSPLVLILAVLGIISLVAAVAIKESG